VSRPHSCFCSLLLARSTDELLIVRVAIASAAQRIRGATADVRTVTQSLRQQQGRCFMQESA
jgi:hypothetical protein